MASFIVECWIWYGFTLALIGMRFVSRFITVGARPSALYAEDWLMLFNCCIYTALAADLDILYLRPTTAIDPALIPSLTPTDISKRAYGGKLTVVGETTTNFALWTTKACILMLYWRLFNKLVQRRVLQFVAIYTALTFIMLEVLYFAYWCRPVQGYFQIAPKDGQCTFPRNHLILSLSFDVSSDLMILAIPVQLFIRTTLPLKRKVLLLLPFCTGIFSIAAALTAKLSALYEISAAYWGYWYIREVSTAIMCANMPYAWSLARKFTNLDSFIQPTPDASPHDPNSQPSQTSTVDSRTRILRAARQSLSFASRKSSTPSALKPGEMPSDRMKFWNEKNVAPQPPQTLAPMSVEDYPSVVNRFHARHSIAAPSEPAPNAEPEQVMTALGATSRRKERAKSWHPGAHSIDKLYHLAEIDDEEDIEHEVDGPQRDLEQGIRAGQDVEEAPTYEFGDFSFRQPSTKGNFDGV